MQGPANELKTMLEIFNRTALEVCEGQQMDMNFESRSHVTTSEYTHMITLKTAVLLGCALELGAHCAGAKHDQARHIYEFGKHIGIAFQLIDDRLDVFGDPEKFGKQVGGDILSDKKTWLLIRAFESANADQLHTLNSYVGSRQFKDEEKVKAIKSVYESLGLPDAMQTEIDKHMETALHHLNVIDASPKKKEALKQFALQLLQRDS